MKHNSIPIISIALAFAMLMPSCKSKKNLVQTPKQTVTQTVSKDKTLEAIIAAQPTFASASASNAKVTVEAKDRKISATSDININYDKTIKASVKIMGIEMGIAEITPDGIRIIDKLNKRYADMTYKYLQDKTGLPLTYNDIQALITNHIFCIGTAENKIKSLKPKVQTDGFKSLITFASNGLTYNYTFDPATYRIVNTEIQLAEKKYVLNTAYSQFETNDNINFPHSITLSVSTPKNKATLTFKLPKTDFNKGAFTAPYNVQKLTKVSIDTFMQYLQ